MCGNSTGNRARSHHPAPCGATSSVAPYCLGACLLTRKNRFVRPNPLHLLEQCDGTIGKWYAMIAMALHTTGRNSPNAPAKIDLVPSRTNHFSCSGRRQNRKLQRLGCDARALSKCRHERWELTKWQRGMMLDVVHLRSSWEQLIKMATPTRWVLTSPKTASFRPIEYSLDTTA